jgi:hypothetical protein
MKAISYALFGSGVKHENSFNFETYLSGLVICIRQNRILYPHWVTVLQTDQQTADKYSGLLDSLPIIYEINEPEPLTKSMLWRMKPVFDTQFTHVMCRDLDSPATLREKKCIEYWLGTGKAAHAITDSISHTVPMMGGMIAFVQKNFAEITGFSTWDSMFVNAHYDFNRKGADQDLLNQRIYPKFAQPGRDSITQHYILGMPNTFLSDWSNQIPDIGIDGFEGADDVTGHIGAAGYYIGQLLQFWEKHPDPEMDAIEKQFTNVAFWQR